VDRCEVIARSQIYFFDFFTFYFCLPLPSHTPA
jgi:hypothetical protein